ncbi:hypothetical protein FZC83_01975 [Rossellomorea marisflavi]|uniref:Uncharacterized protein n=1 Tax=Rossellomorea marisflavi TaxID=189381 RepID=A0A5D4RY98_9BACI|nr:hypothetical protein [Rossellomorea marisflavi]TYS56363.1 hypothetical protein FZC83_01975 [Rossellomorea marisflavi]
MDFKKLYSGMRSEEHVVCHFIDDLCGELDMGTIDQKYLTAGIDDYWIEQLTMDNGDVYNCYIHLKKANDFKDRAYVCIAEKQ